MRRHDGGSAGVAFAPDARVRPSSLIGSWRRFWCGVRGHTDVLTFEPTKLALRCGNCGRESVGWEIQPGDPTRFERDGAYVRMRPSGIRVELS